MNNNITYSMSQPTHLSPLGYLLGIYHFLEKVLQMPHNTQHRRKAHYKKYWCHLQQHYDNDPWSRVHVHLQIHLFSTLQHFLCKNISIFKKSLRPSFTHLYSPNSTTAILFCIMSLVVSNREKLQSVQNTAVQHITCSCKYDHITPILFTLH